LIPKYCEVLKSQKKTKKSTNFWSVDQQNPYNIFYFSSRSFKTVFLILEHESNLVQ
jgi:hypothetical protein